MHVEQHTRKPVPLGASEKCALVRRTRAERRVFPADQVRERPVFTVPKVESTPESEAGHGVGGGVRTEEQFFAK